VAESVSPLLAAFLWRTGAWADTITYTGLDFTIASGLYTTWIKRDGDFRSKNRHLPANLPHGFGFESARMAHGACQTE